MVTVTVERPGGQDRFGNPQSSSTHTVDNCDLFPAGSTEQHHLQSTVEWDKDLFGPFDADITAQDIILLPGDTTRYEVHGEPQRWEGPDGWQPGTVVRLKAASG